VLPGYDAQISVHPEIKIKEESASLKEKEK
jgi:hypothetical protein